MAFYLGQTIAVIAAAVDPAHKNQISDATATVEFYKPPKLPAKNTGDRTVDAGPYSMVFDAGIKNADGTTGAYVAYVDTGDAAFTATAGKWAYKVTLTGSYDSWAYGSVTLTA